MVKSDLLQQLASADQFELVRQVQELYCDFNILDSGLFDTRIYNTRCLDAPEGSWGKHEEWIFNRSLDSLLVSYTTQLSSESAFSHRTPFLGPRPRFVAPLPSRPFVPQASLLAIKKRPIIRYQRESAIAKKLAISVMQKMKEEGDLFHTQVETKEIKLPTHHPSHAPHLPTHFFTGPGSPLSAGSA